MQKPQIITHPDICIPTSQRHGELAHRTHRKGLDFLILGIESFNHLLIDSVFIKPYHLCIPRHYTAVLEAKYSMSHSAASGTAVDQAALFCHDHSRPVVMGGHQYIGSAQVAENIKPLALD